MTDTERLVAAAIRRDGVLHRGRPKGSHWEIRSSLGDEEPNRSRRTDEEGFVTSNDRFVDRRRANEVAVASGQCRSLMGRPMLSSDLDWDAKPSRPQAKPPPRRMFRP